MMTKLQNIRALFNTLCVRQVKKNCGPSEQSIHCPEKKNKEPLPP